MIAFFIGFPFILVEITGDRVFSVHVGDAQANVVLSHDVAVMFQHFFDPPKVEDKVFIIHLCGAIIHCSQNTQICIVDCLQKTQILVGITTLVHFFSEKPIEVVQAVKPMEVSLCECFIQSAKICCKVLVFVFLEELLAALAFENLAEELDYASLVHSLDYGLHHLRSLLVESHQLERALVAEWSDESAEVIIGGLLGLPLNYSCVCVR